jgi:hypothetical protein
VITGFGDLCESKDENKRVCVCVCLCLCVSVSVFVCVCVCVSVCVCGGISELFGLVLVRCACL